MCASVARFVQALVLAAGLTAGPVEPSARDAKQDSKTAPAKIETASPQASKTETRTEPAKAEVAKFARAKPLKRAGWPAKAGIKTPGTQIPFDDLKSDAAIATDGGAPNFMYFSDQVYVASKSKEGVHRVDPKTNKVLDTIAGVKKPCGGFVSAFGTLWIGDCSQEKLVRIDTKEKKVKASVDAIAIDSAQAIASSADSVWVISDAKTTLSRIDPDENKIVAEVRLPAGCNSVLFGEQALWVTCPSLNAVLRLDPQTNLVANKIDVSGEPFATVAAEGAVWVFTRKEGKLLRIDPKTNKVAATIELKTPELEASLAFGEGNIWVSSSGYPISRIEPTAEKEKVAQQFAGEAGGNVWFGSGSVWLSDAKTSSAVRFDPKRIKATLAE